MKVAGPPLRYNARFDRIAPTAMEAERLNALSALLEDLSRRATDLRRYL